MTYKIVLSEIVEKEIAAVRDWYNEKALQLGADFVLTIEDSFARIAYNPVGYPVVLFGKYRRALVRRFPYAVYFRIEGSDIKISALFHHSRSPEILYNNLH